MPPKIEGLGSVNDARIWKDSDLSEEARAHLSEVREDHAKKKAKKTAEYFSDPENIKSYQEEIKRSEDIRMRMKAISSEKKSLENEQEALEDEYDEIIQKLDRLNNRLGD